MICPAVFLPSSFVQGFLRLLVEEKCFSLTQNEHLLYFGEPLEGQLYFFGIFGRKVDI